jgi:hypothetical protein
MKPIYVDLGKNAVSSYLEYATMLSDVTTSTGTINTTTLTSEGSCLKFVNKAIDVFKIIAQGKNTFFGQSIKYKENDEVQLVTLRQTKDTAFLFETFKKLGLSMGYLSFGICWNKQTIYLSPKLLKDLSKFAPDVVRMLSMYLLSLHKLLYNLCNTKDVFVYEPYATAVQVPETLFTKPSTYIQMFTEETYTWTLEEINLNDIVDVSYFKNMYSSMVLIEDSNKLTGNFTIIKETNADNTTQNYYMLFTYGTLAINPTYYIISSKDFIISNTELCGFDIDAGSLLSKLCTFLPSSYISKIIVDKEYMKNRQASGYTYSIETLDEMDNSDIRTIFEAITKYLLDRGANDSIGAKQLEEILEVKVVANKYAFDVDSLKEQYADDEYAQHLYMQEQEYFSTFNLKDLTPCLKGFAKGDIYSMMFLGESGTGKSTAAKVIPTRCGLPFVLVNFSVNIEESDLFGSMIPNTERTSELDSEFKWQDGVITRAIRNGYVCVLEEINFARPGVLGKLNSLLDEARQIDLPNGEVLKAHPNFRMIATCNIAYEGTNRFNKALINRFEIVKEFIDLNREETITIINERLGYAERAKIEMVYNVYEAIKKYSREQNANVVISIRQMINIFSKGKYFKNAYDAVINMLINSAFIEEQEYKAHFIETVLVGFDLNFKI